MRLKRIEIQFPWNDDLLVHELRSIVLLHLDKEGKPLRWAITSIQPSKIEGLPRQVKVEAVVIVD